MSNGWGREKVDHSKKLVQVRQVMIQCIFSSFQPKQLLLTCSIPVQTTHLTPLMLPQIRKGHIKLWIREVGLLLKVALVSSRLMLSFSCFWSSVRGLDSWTCCSLSRIVEYRIIPLAIFQKHGRQFQNTTNALPARYLLKIESFSLLSEHGISKYE